MARTVFGDVVADDGFGGLKNNYLCGACRGVEKKVAMKRKWKKIMVPKKTRGGSGLSGQVAGYP